MCSIWWESGESEKSLGGLLEPPYGAVFVPPRDWSHSSGWALPCPMQGSQGLAHCLSAGGCANSWPGSVSRWGPPLHTCRLCPWHHTSGHRLLPTLPLMPSLTKKSPLRTWLGYGDPCSEVPNKKWTRWAVLSRDRGESMWSQPSSCSARSEKAGGDSTMGSFKHPTTYVPWNL